MMRRYFATAMTAHLRAGGSLYLLTVLGVALGVAAVLSIQIINRNAIAAFAGSVKAVSGEADLSVLGYTPNFPEDIYPRVLSTPGVQAAWPLWRAAVALSGAANVMLDLIGVDFFTPVDIPWQGEPTDPAVALSQPGWVALTPLLADQMGWRVGDTFTVSWGSRRVRLTVGARVDFHALNPLASPKLAVMDIAQAQNLFGDAGVIHQIDVKLAAGTDAAAMQTRLQERLGPGVRVVTPEQRETQAKGLLAAFQLNLTALSLISLFVGVFSRLQQHPGGPGAAARGAWPAALAGRHAPPGVRAHHHRGRPARRPWRRPRPTAGLWRGAGQRAGGQRDAQQPLPVGRNRPPGDDPVAVRARHWHRRWRRRGRGATAGSRPGAPRYPGAAVRLHVARNGRQPGTAPVSPSARRCCSRPPSGTVCMAATGNTPASCSPWCCCLPCRC